MSIAKIAETTQISPATVSRVLNGYDGVSPEKVRKVRTASRELGYVHTPRRKGKVAIGPTILWGNVMGQGPSWAPYAPSMMQGVQETAAQLGVNLVIGDLSSVDKLPPLATNRQIDGVLLSAVEVSDDVLRQFEHLPIVWSTSHVTQRGSQIIEGNNTICRQALDYLVARGHRNVGVMAVDASHPAIGQRADMFEFLCNKESLACTSYHGPLRDGHSFNTGQAENLEAALDQAIGQWKRQKDRPSALFFASSTQIMLAYRVLARHGINPLKDVDIIACGQRESVVTLYPRPTIIEISAYKMGAQAVRYLMSMVTSRIRGEQVHLVIEPELVPGDVVSGAAWKVAV